jgi:hypothetical protein
MSPQSKQEYQEAIYLQYKEASHRGGKPSWKSSVPHGTFHRNVSHSIHGTTPRTVAQPLSPHPMATDDLMPESHACPITPLISLHRIDRCATETSVHIPPKFLPPVPISSSFCPQSVCTSSNRISRISRSISVRLIGYLHQ